MIAANSAVHLPRPKYNEDVMPISEAKMKRSSGFRVRKCRAARIDNYGAIKWFNPQTIRFELAKPEYVTVAIMIELLRSSEHCYLYILNPDTPKPDKPKEVQRVRTCAAGDVLGVPITRMISANPTHDTFREAVRTRLGMAIPNAAITWPAIKDWIEFNYPFNGHEDDSPVGDNMMVVRCDTVHSETGTATVVRSYSRCAEIVISGDKIKAAINKVKGANSIFAVSDALAGMLIEETASHQGSAGAPSVIKFTKEAESVQSVNLPRTAIEAYIRDHLRETLEPSELAKWSLH